MSNNFQLRKIIRNLINEVLLTRHFKERADWRLDGPSDTTDFPGKYPHFKKTIYDAIDFLEKKVDFEDDIKAGIWISCPQMYKTKRPSGSADSWKDYVEGDRIYFILQYGNELHTVVFEKSTKKRLGDGYIIPFEKLRKYVEENNKKLLSHKDIKIILKPEVKQVEKPIEYVYNIGGKKYGIDLEKNTIYVKNKPSVSYDVFSVLDDKVPELKLDDKVKDEIMTLIL